MRNLLVAAALAVGVLLASVSAAEETIGLDELADAFGWDFESEVTVETLGDGFYVLFGVGGNIAVSVGENGTLIVDDQFPEMIPKVGDAIRAIGGGARLPSA